MKLKFLFASVIFASLFFVLALPNTALADTVTLSGNVQTSSGSAVVGATVSLNDSNNDSTTTNSSGNYSVSIPSGTYNVQVTPPSGSNLSSAIALSQSISSNANLNFILTPSGTVSLSGYIYDASGNPLVNQLIALRQPGTNALVTSIHTDSNGYYSLQATPNTYNIAMSGTSNSLSAAAPEAYSLNGGSYSLTQSTIIDFTLSAKEINTHVQDPQNNAVSGVQIQTQGGGGSSVTIGPVTFSTVSSSYGGQAGTAPVTDQNGNATLWLFSTTSDSPYSFVATPPSGSSYIATTLSNISFTSNVNETIILQQPVTLSGHIYDAAGEPLANQSIALRQPGTNALVTSTTTDSTGSYSLQASPNTYNIAMSGTRNVLSASAPEAYTLNGGSYSLSQNSTLDFTLPSKEISVHVQDSQNNAISGVQIQTQGGGGSSVTIDSVRFSTVSSSYGGQAGTAPVTDQNGNVTLWLFVTTSDSPYSFVATPPNGSSYVTTTASNISFTSNTNETIVMQQPVTLSGHIYDSQGNPLANQSIALRQPGTNALVTSTTTNSSGSYSLQTNANTYNIAMTGSGNSFSSSAPEAYTLNGGSYALTQNTTLDFTLPAKKISVHIQDPQNNAVSNVQIQTLGGGGSSVTIGSVTFSTVSSSYGGQAGTAPVTDSSGNVNLWLFATTSDLPYSFVATPPTNSIYSQFTLNNISFTQNQNELVQLEYNHATPITTATLSPTPFSDGTYADPTTVTLSATAASGFTIANTFYKIDSGSPQTYTTPFSVTGAGSHTITYWSVDNSGVTEATNTKTFTITESYSLTGTVYNDSNQDGVLDDGEAGYNGATVTLNTGQSTTTDSNGNYTFSNLESGTYIETLTVPSGYFATTTNPADVALSANTTQNFGIAQASSLVTAINAGGDTEGSFAADADFSGGSTFSSGSTVDTSGVTNPALQAVYQTVRFGNFTYTVPNLTPNTAYTLRLHFNEVYFGANGNSGGVGSRVFNVSVNGTNALSNFDIYQAAGGANKAVVEELPATSDSSGNITVQFSSVVDNAMVNGIEVDSGSPATTPTPTPTPITSEAINAGGGTEGSFVSDIDSSGGTTFSTTADVDTTGVTNPAPESVYQSVRYGGNFTYDLTNFAPNSSHTVRLHFSEPYWGTALSSNQGGDGSRVFNVSINGTQVLTNFDVYQTAGGADKAVIEEFPVSADANGKISIQFTTVTDNAMVSGIEVN